MDALSWPHSLLAITTQLAVPTPALLPTYYCAFETAEQWAADSGSPPTRAAAESVSRDWKNVLVLSRLVVAPGEPQNAAGMLLGQSMRMLPARWHTLLTYADSRKQHKGTIYKATNWIDLGETKGDPVWVDAAGRQVAKKCAGHTRTVAEMIELGCIRLPVSKKRKFVFYRTRAARSSACPPLAGPKGAIP